MGKQILTSFIPYVKIRWTKDWSPKSTHSCAWHCPSSNATTGWHALTFLLPEQEVHKVVNRCFSVEKWHSSQLAWMESLTSETSSSFSAMPVGPHNFTEKQVSRGDLVAVCNEQNCLQVLNTRRFLARTIFFYSKTSLRCGILSSCEPVTHSIYDHAGMLKELTYWQSR